MHETAAAWRVKRWVGLALSLWVGMAGAGEIPAEFRGTWKPQATGCRSQAALVVTKDQLVLRKANQRRAFGDVDLCYSCEGGARYQGIVVWAAPGFAKGREGPFTVHFNADEKKGVTVIEPLDPHLARQFPVMGMRLRKCP